MIASVLSEEHSALGLAQNFVVSSVPVISVLFLILKLLFSVLEHRPNRRRRKRRRRRRCWALTFSVATRNDLRRRACILRICSKGKGTKKRSIRPKKHASKEPPTVPGPSAFPIDCRTERPTAGYESMFTMCELLRWFWFPISVGLLVAFHFGFPILAYCLGVQTDGTTFAAVLNQTCPRLDLVSALVTHPLPLTPVGSTSQ